MSAAASSDARIKTVEVSEEMITAQLADGQIISVPLPTPEQVHAAATEFARARPRQQELDPALLDQTVDLVQEFRQTLDLVDDDDAVGGREFLGDAPRLLAQGEIGRMVEEVIEPHAWERVADQETLSRLPGSEQEVRLLPNQPREIEGALDESFECHRKRRAFTRAEGLEVEHQPEGSLHLRHASRW